MGVPVITLALAAVAWAHPGIVHPDAAPTDVGEVSVALGMGVLGEIRSGIHDPYDSGPLLAEAEAGWAPTDALRVDLACGMLVYSGDLVAPLIRVGARYLAATRKGLGIAPFADVIVLDSTWLSSVGIALEGGWESVRLDIALPLFSASDLGFKDGTIVPLFPPFSWITAEAGITWSPVPAHALRLGLVGWAPNLCWTIRFDRYFLNALAGISPLTVYPVVLLGGLRFGARF